MVIELYVVYEKVLVNIVRVCEKDAKWLVSYVVRGKSEIKGCPFFKWKTGLIVGIEIN